MTNVELTRKVQELVNRIEQLESKDTKNEKCLYTIAEIAERLSVTKEAVYYMVKRGELPTVKLGTMKVRAADFEQILGRLG